MSMLTVATDFLKRTRRREISQSEFLTIMVDATGYSRESVRGTIIGHGRKLFGQSRFQRSWAACIADPSRGKRKRLIRRKDMTAADIEFEIDYDTPAKEAARERGLRHLTPGKHRPRVITFAATEGYCVKSILARCPNADITNLERDPKVLATWESKGIPTNNVLCEFSDYIRTEEFTESEYKLLNADFVGYASRTLHNDLVYLDQWSNIKTIVLTINGIKRFRNHGAWVDYVTAKYQSDDPTLEWVTDIMNNYRVVDYWFYVRNPKRGSRRMRMFVLERI